MDTKFGFNANIKVEVFSADGQLKDKREVHNVVTDTGVYAILDQILVTPDNGKVGWMGLGSGNTLTTGGIQTLIAGSINALTSKTRANKVITMVGDWDAGDGTGTISEAGTLYQGTTAYPCVMYATFAGIVKGAADTLKITWTLTGAN